MRDLKPRHAHDLLTSSIIPRPIAWVSTINAKGAPNLAPFSFFTGVSWYPPVLAFSAVNREDGSKKDTVINIEETKEFVINLVSKDLLHPMECSAGPIPFGEDITFIKGITLAPSKTIRPSRICEARVSFECVLDRIVSVSEGANAGNLIIGRVLSMYAQDEIVKDEREIDWQGLDALGRLSGNRYCTIQSIIESETH
ncbi:NADH-FMN oxidoreductase RutF, flavin reductase (DIM6/NTAB) family [Acetanaerobacterium elongatum]|uniref:NADH-FMN oxidoreductase RutF, flavin reductase (DIM6/NTAB) family n=1 Tax=Acetanaerobacterium elongatum TaxID=258515 RepID=A0A1G9W841_9FIRM|nr:NADH-FMN oxidoreductase RutF, flavin reductase (DIM6/NTAB) family [Acetanaerobacterium elongatum]